MPVRSSHPLTLLSALSGGALMAFAFPDFNLPWLSLVALVPLGWTWELHARPGEVRALRGAFGKGYLFGIGLFGLGLRWIAQLPLKELTHPWVLAPAQALLVLYLSSYIGLAGVLYIWVRRARVPAGPALVLSWLAVEWFRSEGEMGFPWFSLGYAWFRSPEMIQWASLGGVAAVSAWVAGANALLLEGLLRRGVRSRAALILAAVGLLALVAWTGIQMRRSIPGGESVRVALIQPNISGDRKWNPIYLHENVLIHRAMTLALAARHPQLAIWPETAVPAYLRYDDTTLAMVEGCVDSLGAPLLVGFADARRAKPGARLESFNSAAVVNPGGSLGPVYDKMHLVPFGERLPFQSLFPFLGRIDFGQAEWLPGSEARALEAGPTRVGVLICFESIFSEPSRTQVKNGARALVNITNDEWFGAHDAPWQHAGMSVFRSVENRVGLARCANTGVSFLVDPDGTIAHSTGLFVPASRVESLRLGGEPTFFNRHGEWLARALGVLALFFSVLGILRGRVSRRAARRATHA